MGWASRQNQMINDENLKDVDRTAYIVFPNETLKDEYHDFTKRTRQLLDAAKGFVEGSVTLDDGDPDFSEKITPHIGIFFITLMLIYPDPAQLDKENSNVRGGR